MTPTEIEAMKKELAELTRIVESLALGERLAQLAARVASVEAQQTG